jgi:4'-phosphopantetheinyl transferase
LHCTVAHVGVLHKNTRLMEIMADIRELPVLGNDTIHIWGIHVPDLLDRVDALHCFLCRSEQEKAARFHRDADRHSSIAARGALRILLSGYTGIPAAEIQFQYSENGKPSLKPSASSRPLAEPVPQAARLPGSAAGSRRAACDTVAFNVSHSGDWVVLAIGRDRKIGVDVEKIKSDLDVRGIAARFLAPEEIALIDKAEDPHSIFFQLWARKEAYVKACGSALFRELSSFSVPIENGKLSEVSSKDGWFFRRLEAGSKYAAAVVTDKALAHMPCYDFGGLKWDS